LITDLKIFENYCKDCIPEWYEKIKRARLLLQQKRVVSREFILRWTKFINKAPTDSMMQSEYIMREILKELGEATEK